MCTERTRQQGLTLIELIVFIVIVGVAVAGILSALNVAVRSSADPQVHKQAMSIAESLLEEIELQPHTYCDPDDANAAIATSTAGCATTAEALGPEAGETRAGIPRFDNVNDYHGLTMNGGIQDITGTTLAGLGGYSATVNIAADDGLNGIPATDALRITVTVTGPGNTVVTLDGYRTRYAPRAG